MRLGKSEADGAKFIVGKEVDMERTALRKIVIQENDCEKYTVRLPLKIAFSKNRKKYLLSELEKLHPRFSSSCCIDTKLLFKEKKLFAFITVMDKIRLSECRRHFPNKKLYVVNGNKMLSVFSAFKSRTAVVFIVTVVTIFISLLLANRRDNPPVAMDSYADFKTEEVLIQPSKLISIFYEAIKSEGGVIKGFEYAASKNSVEIKASLEACLPEKIVQRCSILSGIQVFLSPIRYEKWTAAFSISLKATCTQREALDFPLENFAQRLREVIKENKAELLAEDFSPYSADILCSNDAATPLCRCISDELTKSSVGITSFSIENSSAGKDMLHFTFSTSGNVMDSIVLCLSLLKKTHPKVLSSIVPRNKTSEKKAVDEIIGEILREDGTKVFFLKNPNGKIVMDENLDKRKFNQRAVQ